MGLPGCNHISARKHKDRFLYWKDCNFAKHPLKVWQQMFEHTSDDFFLEDQVKLECCSTPRNTLRRYRWLWCYHEVKAWMEVVPRSMAGSVLLWPTISKCQSVSETVIMKFDIQLGFSYYDTPGYRLHKNGSKYFPAGLCVSKVTFKWKTVQGWMDPWVAYTKVLFSWPVWRGEWLQPQHTYMALEYCIKNRLKISSVYKVSSVFLVLYIQKRQQQKKEAHWIQASWVYFLFSFFFYLMIEERCLETLQKDVVKWILSGAHCSSWSVPHLYPH